MMQLINAISKFFDLIIKKGYPMKYVQMIHHIVSQIGLKATQLFCHSNKHLPVREMTHNFPQKPQFPKRFTLDSQAVGILFIRWLAYMIQSGNFIPNHRASPIHKLSKNLIGVVKPHAIAQFCEAYALNDYWSYDPKNKVFKAIKKTRYFIEVDGVCTFKYRVKDKSGKMIKLPLLLIDERHFQLKKMDININRSLIVEGLDTLKHHSKCAMPSPKTMEDILMASEKHTETEKNLYCTGPEWLYTEQDSEQLDSHTGTIQAATGSESYKRKLFNHFDTSLLPDLPNLEFPSIEAGEFFIQWLKVMIKHRRFEINKNNSPVHKITAHLIGILTPKIFLMFCQDYNIDVLSTNTTNRIRNSVKKAGYLVSHVAAKKEIFKCNLLGKNDTLYFCLIYEKDLIENNVNIPVNLTLTLQETP